MQCAATRPASCSSATKASRIETWRGCHWPMTSAAILGCFLCKSCVKQDMTCELFNCTGNWTKLPNAASRRGPQHFHHSKRLGSDVSTCCAPTCAMFDCAASGLPKQSGPVADRGDSENDPKALQRLGHSSKECCLKAGATACCSAFFIDWLFAVAFHCTGTKKRPSVPRPRPVGTCRIL